MVASRKTGFYWYTFDGAQEMFQLYREGWTLRVGFRNGASMRYAVLGRAERASLVGPIPPPDDPRWKALVGG